MDSMAIFYTTTNYNPESLTKQEAWLNVAIFLSVVEGTIQCANKIASPSEC
jgi:Na+/glutamate symporter